MKTQKDNKIKTKNNKSMFSSVKNMLITNLNSNFEYLLFIFKIYAPEFQKSIDFWGNLQKYK